MRFKKGARVMRGPSWEYGRQDCTVNGERVFGTVLGAGASNRNMRWVKVKWDNGHQNEYPTYHDEREEVLDVIVPAMSLTKFFEL